MTEDQSVVGRRRIYYDSDGNETLIASDSEEEDPGDDDDKEELNHDFSQNEDSLIWYLASTRVDLTSFHYNFVCVNPLKPPCLSACLNFFLYRVVIRYIVKCANTALLCTDLTFANRMTIQELGSKPMVLDELSDVLDIKSEEIEV